MNWRTGSCQSFLKKSLIPRAILEIMTKRALDPIRGRRIVGTMTMSMIGTGTIMIVIMIAIAPCTAPSASQEKMTPLGHPFPITETGTDPPTEIENINLPTRSHRSREPDDISQTTV